VLPLFVVLAGGVLACLLVTSPTRAQSPVDLPAARQHADRLADNFWERA